jgi:uncharacterized membrane-anchored protein YhcB (DUF1043 family)
VNFFKGDFMDIMMGVGIFFLGVLAGAGLMFTRNKLDAGVQQTKKELTVCRQENAQLKQEWQDNLAVFRSVSTNLKEVSQHIDRQIDDAEKQLAKEYTTTAYPFFSDEATQILKENAEGPRVKNDISSQPLDYSGSASGVFNGEPVAEEKKPEVN